MSLLIVLAFTGALLYLCKYLYDQSTYWERRGIPGPPTKFYFGNTKELNAVESESCRQINAWSKMYGKVYGIKNGTISIMVTSDLEMIHEVFFKQFDNFYDRRPRPFGHGVDRQTRVHLIESRGQKWKRLRAIAAPSFTIAALKKMTPVIDDSALQMVRILEERNSSGEIFDIYRYFVEFTSDTINRLVCGQKESKLFNNPRVAIMKAIMERNQNSFVHHLVMAFQPLGEALRYIGIMMNIPELRGVFSLIKDIEAIVQKRMANREVDGPPKQSQDYLDIFLDNLQDDAVINHNEFKRSAIIQKTMNHNEVVMQGLMFILAGFDTTSISLGNAAWKIAKHPHVQRMCQEEVDQVCQDESISFEECNELKYIEAVCKEVLRFHPLANRAVARSCTNATTVCGYEIERGVVIMADCIGIHFDKSIWGEDAEEFNPQRWLDPSRKVPAHAYLPFGAGPRVCIGLKLALLEMKLALAHTLRKFDIFPDESMTEPQQLTYHTTGPKDVPIRIVKRS